MLGVHRTAKCSYFHIHTPSEMVVPEFECTPKVSLWLLHAVRWPWITSISPLELDRSVPSCMHTDWKNLVTRKKKSRCRNKGPCAVGSIARSCTSHPTVADCSLDFIARERSTVEGLNMSPHLASKLHHILLRSMFSSGLVGQPYPAALSAYL